MSPLLYSFVVPVRAGVRASDHAPVDSARGYCCCVCVRGGGMVELIEGSLPWQLGEAVYRVHAMPFRAVMLIVERRPRYHTHQPRCQPCAPLQEVLSGTCVFIVL